ncbi:hypothetical protein J5X84_28460 [Streptosporangiaceae bacterium NEAU-GS5]|nr:hypothetical protein [Streptosporangiaceae bacterium NEAU-GS5]
MNPRYVSSALLMVLPMVLCMSLMTPAAAHEREAAVPLKGALLVPKDLGSEFAHRGYLTDGLRQPTFKHTKACGAAAKAAAGVYRTKVTTAIKHKERWEGISEYIVSGTRHKISTLERAAKDVVRHCQKITIKTWGSQDIIRKLSIGRLGDATYGIKFRSGFPDGDLERDSELPAEMMVAIDIVIIRVGNTLIVLEHDGNVGQFDPKLTKSAAKTAVARLKNQHPH